MERKELGTVHLDSGTESLPHPYTQENHSGEMAGSVTLTKSLPMYRDRPGNFQRFGNDLNNSLSRKFFLSHIFFMTSIIRSFYNCLLTYTGSGGLPPLTWTFLRLCLLSSIFIEGY